MRSRDLTLLSASFRALHFEEAEVVHYTTGAFRVEANKGEQWEMLSFQKSYKIPSSNPFLPLFLHSIITFKYPRQLLLIL